MKPPHDNRVPQWVIPRRATVLLILFSSLLMVALPLLTHAQTNYNLTWWTVDGGGGTLSDSSAPYTLIGTIGQPDASAALTGGSYTLVGGFFARGSMPGHITYLPIIFKQR